MELGVGGVQDRWQQHGHDPKEQEPASGRHAVSAESLNFVLEAAEEEPAAENEQKVGQNRSQHAQNIGFRVLGSGLGVGAARGTRAAGSL